MSYCPAKSSSTYSMAQIATFMGVTGLTDEASLYVSKNILAS
jgi:hypothetical protein